MILTTPLRLLLALGLVAATFLATGCRQDMQDQPKLEAFEQSELFADGIANQTPPEGTVARGLLKEDTRYWLGRQESGALVSELPDEIDWSRQLLVRGEERFGIFCAPCHDSSGSGRGMIVRRGFKQPQPLYEDRLVEMPIGYFYDVMTHGFGVMPSYAVQVPVEDRWAIAAYVRVLQASQGRQLESLPAEVREEFRQAMAAPPETSEDHADDHGGGH